jgi:hypothetical protein
MAKTLRNLLAAGTAVSTWYYKDMFESVVMIVLKYFLY